MKVLVIPMSAMAETSGPASRCELLTEGFKKANMEVCTCMAKDVNFREIKGVYNYDLDAPMPLGLPRCIATKTFPMAQKLGITSRKAVHSFDEVLFLTGNLNYRYIKRSVEQIVKAIEHFQPDLVYSEFNISALIAAKLKNVRSCATVSFPTQHSYARKEKLAKDINRVLTELSISCVSSALELFEFADLKFCFSIEELEPFRRDDVVFCGTLKTVVPEEKERKKILVYMGNGTVSASKTFQVVKDAFENTNYEVYLASSYLEEQTVGNIHVAHRWNFNAMLEEAALFINHGGQNSVVDGLIYGVPQIVVPGKVFERIYNAEKLAENRAGRLITLKEFTADGLRLASEEILRTPEMTENARILGTKLMEAGGIDTLICRLLS